MSLLDIFKKDKKDAAASKAPASSKAQADSKLQDKPVKVAKKQKDSKKDAGKNKLVKPSKKNTKNAYKVLIKPLITEKSTQTGTYLFMVNSKTNKQEIKKAIQAVYGVEPKKVNVMNFGGRSVRWGKSRGTTRSWKKAIVYLKPEDKIDIYEGV